MFGFFQKQESLGWLELMQIIWHVFRKCCLIILGTSLLGYPLISIAGLEGSQRRSVSQSTYKSCLASAAQSSPQSGISERKRWCECYAGQVVDNVTPDDIKGFSTSSAAPTPRMLKVADDAVDYCRRKLY